jgi:HlyD family secretion protein
MTQRPPVRLLIPLAVVVVVVVAVVLVLRGRNGGPDLEASGTIEATEADLGFSVPGRIATIAVQEGSPVSAGAELASLDREDLLAQRRAAAGQAAAARARLQELQRGFRDEEVAQGRASLRAAMQRLEDAERDLERTRRLFDGGAVSQQRLDDAQTRVTLAEAELERTREALQVLETGPRPEQVAAQRGVLEQAEGTVAQLDAVLEHAVIHAPFDGVVTVRHREPGETVPTGAPVLTLMNPADRWVRIYVREDQVGRINVGDHATISADAYPERTYAGRIVFIASDAEFTPRNVQTTQERVKLVYRVKVQIEEDPAFDLKPGLPADVLLEIGTD